MIHLDADYLILGTTSSTPENANIARWLSERQPLAASAVAWMEFVTGPVTSALVESTRRMIESRIIPIGREEAELAAQLFNATGRKRAMRYDCMIAAGAILAGARLATGNRADYRAFENQGLGLAA